MRSPLAAIIFAIELTRDTTVLLPLLLCVTIAYGVSVLIMRRSILTEKVSRRGHHQSREYSVDPLETVFVRQVMRADVDTLPSTMALSELAPLLHDTPHGRGQRLYPVLDGDGRVAGVVGRSALQRALRDQETDGAASAFADLVNIRPVVAYPNDSLRTVAQRMAVTGVTRVPVVEPETRRLAGMVALRNLLQGRVRNLDAEQRRERILRLRRRAVAIAEPPVEPIAHT